MLAKLKGLVPKQYHAALVFPVIALFLFLLHVTQAVNFHEEDTIDLRFKLRGPRPAHPAITVVAIDDESLKTFGQWPWPRSTHGVFLEVISRFNPRSVFFDMLFTEPGADPKDDEFFSGMVERSGKVILPFFYKSLEPFRAQFPIKPYMEAIQSTTFVNAVEDIDGHVRRTRAFLETPKGTFYAPSFLMAASFSASTDPLAGVPLDSDRAMWINFPGGLKSYRMTTYAEVIALADKDEARLKDLFENRLVLVGHMATGTTDLKITPFASQPGVMVHASSLHTLLTGRYLRALPWWGHLLLLIFLAAGSSQIFKKLYPAPGFGALLIMELLYFALNFGVFVWPGWILPLSVPMTALIASYITSLFMKYTEIYVQKEMSLRELATAARIQEQFLPQTKPDSQDLDMAFEARFTKTVGGDLYDWVDLGGGKYGFCIGDVSGKGMPAAIYMAKSLSDFRSLDKKNKAPEKVLEELNTLMLANPASGMFLTLVYAVVDIPNRKLDYASAGHELTIVFRAGQGKTQVLEGAQGMPLGMFETTYDPCRVSFEKGDAFLLYSDGVKELRSPKGEEFGVARLQEAFRSAMHKGESSASDCLKELFVKMQQYQGKTQAHDDRTLVCLHFPADKEGK